MNQSFDLSSLLTELIYGSGAAEPVEQIVERLLAPHFALRNNGQVYDRSGFIAHVGELRQMAVGGGDIRVLEEISTDAGIAGRYLFRMLSAEGQSLSVEAHVFAKVNDGKVERIVEVARQVENTEEDFLADT
ncbi:hypothetical protein ACIQAC_34330 [Streptomyces sp. NPDC088387]|uniref:hypothetical protein n=1 Tax=Streptomyces sp. NPDC088387 TaxID=3365859 RepID=UPI0038296573